MNGQHNKKEGILFRHLLRCQGKLTDFESAYRTQDSKSSAPGLIRMDYFPSRFSISPTRLLAPIRNKSLFSHSLPSISFTIV